MAVIDLSRARITIVGLGLIGGSLGMALRRRHAYHEVLGVARRPESVEQALELGAIDGGTCDLTEGVRGADIVVLAIPVRAIIALIPKLGSLLPEGCLLLDLGSTKEAIVQAMEALPPHVQPIGGHPMCGKEASGIEAAEADLYEGAVFVLTPLPRTSEEALRLAEELVKAIGARPLVLDARRHDRLVAAISHLPYLLAVGLIDAAECVAAEDETVWTLASSGFRDASRLAASSVPMSLDILLTNRENIAEMVRLFRQRLERIAGLLDAEDEAALRDIMMRVQQRRRGMFK